MLNDCWVALSGGDVPLAQGLQKQLAAHYRSIVGSRSNSDETPDVREDHWQLTFLCFLQVDSPIVCVI